MEHIEIGIEELTKLEDFLSAVPSKNTRKNYLNGISKFEEYVGRSIETLLPGNGQGRIIEKYFIWLKEQGYMQNRGFSQSSLVVLCAWASYAV
jgi:hypothetical protein